MYQLVQQRTDGDCAVACIAMFAKVSYDTVIKDCFEGRDPYGVNCPEEAAALTKLGIYGASVPRFVDSVAGILTVPSLNTRNQWHAVFTDGEKLFDPQNGRESKKFYDCSPYDVLVKRTTVDLNDERSRFFYDVALKQMVGYL